MKKSRIDNYNKNDSDSLYFDKNSFYITNANGAPQIERIDNGILFPEVPTDRVNVKRYKPGD